MEWFVYRLRGLALFELLELAGKLTVVVAVIFWFLEADQRARQAEEAIKERHYRAWELINAAAGKAGDGGRRDALQDLNKDHVSLAGAPLEKAYLWRVDLRGAVLWQANLEGANMWTANLWRALLDRAILAQANLQGADLSEASLMQANLQGADLERAILDGANLLQANLQGADLQDAKLRGANLAGASGLTQQQLDTADGDDRTVLPEGLVRPAHWSKTK